MLQFLSPKRVAIMVPMRFSASTFFCYMYKVDVDVYRAVDDDVRYNKDCHDDVVVGWADSSCVLL